VVRVVVDANIIAAALIRPDGWTAGQLARADIDWMAPELVALELDEHAAEYAAKAGCSAGEWRRRTEALLTRFRLVPTGVLLAADRSKEVRKAARTDPDDAIYVAAAVATGADLLWTRDRRLLAAFPGLAVSVVPQG